jgi:hypothetical protein
MPGRERGDGVARAFGGSLVPGVLASVTALYFAGVFFEAARSGTAAKYLGKVMDDEAAAPWAYFTQLAALFPGASRHAIDYRVEGYRCRDRAWAEIDVRPLFPIDADSKENRFYRAIHFYGDAHPHRQTLHALDDFIVRRYDADAIDAAARGEPREPIGGVRFVKVTVPFGAPGDGSPRYERRPLADYPEDQKKALYHTPESKREERCRPVTMGETPKPPASR